MDLSDKNILITLCARNGSKGVKGKNNKLMAGKPLIEYSIDLAKKLLKYFPADIGLSTDSTEIKQLAGNFGLDTSYNRPEETATDTASKIDAIVDVKKYYESFYDKSYDYVLDLDVSSPLRSEEDILNAFKLIENDPTAFNLFSVSEADKNPYFNMVEQQDTGYFGLSKKKSLITSRQSAPDVYALNASFYIYRKSFFDSNQKGAITEKSLIYKVPHICFDVDNELEFDFMEFLIVNNKLDFTL